MILLHSPVFEPYKCEGYAFPSIQVRLGGHYCAIRAVGAMLRSVRLTYLCLSCAAVAATIAGGVISFAAKTTIKTGSKLLVTLSGGHEDAGEQFAYKSVNNKDILYTQQ